MSLLYKALNQASQVREKAGARPEAAEAATAHTSPVAERILAQSIAGGGAIAGRRPISRIVLVSLLGVTALATAAVFMMPPAEFQPLDAPPPELAQPVEPAVTPVPVEAVVQQPEPEVPVEQLTPEPQIETATPEQAAEPETAPPERIGAEPAPYEPVDAPAPARVSDRGMEKFVDGQIGQTETAGLGPPVDLTGEAETESPAKSKIEITDDTDRLRADYENAARLLDGGQPAAAQQIYAGILRNAPNDRLALLGRAAAFQRMLRTNEAVAAYEAVLAAYPGDEWALTNLLALLSGQNSTQALAQLQRLIRLNPEKALVPAQVGMIHLARGEYEPAARHLEKAVALEPKNAKYIFNLAVVYDKWGQSEQALRFYAQCLDLAARDQNSQIPVEIVRQRMAFLTVK